MLTRAQIAALIPHQGAMCLLDAALRWNATGIDCRATSHLDPANPLRLAGRLGIACGIEYGLQAAALHGALAEGSAQPPGYLAGLRDVAFGAERLDDPAHGPLAVSAELERREAAGLIYAFRIAAEDGRALVAGRATIMLRRAP
jgi:predicted hotdog family 3-hydroxylacyl-ACP dehydratase